jgi:hypothetical protein
MTSRKCVEVEVLTAVAMKSSVFWDITTCGPLKVNLRFEGTYRLCLQGQRIHGDVSRSSHIKYNLELN